MAQQTKESFEKYLKEAKQEASTLGPLQSHIDQCPFCYTGKPELKAEVFNHIIGNNIWSGTAFRYACPDCKESFTTDKSDMISIASLEITK